MDLHRIEIVVGLIGLSLGLALLIGIATSDSRKQAVRYLIPALVIASSAIVLLDGYKAATQAQLVATHDSKDNVVVIEDGRPTAYVRSSPTRYVGDEFSLEYTRSGGVEAYIKGELGERQVRVDRVRTHHDKTELVVNGDDVTLHLHQ